MACSTDSEFTRTKHPDAIIDIPIHWHSWIGTATIASAETVVKTGSVTAVSTSIDSTSRITKSRFSGGTDGETAHYEVKATLSDGQVLVFDEGYIEVIDN